MMNDVLRQPAFLPKKTSEELPGHVPHACGLMPGARGAMLGGCRVSDGARGVCAWVGGCGGIRATTVWRGGAYMCTSILHSERTNTYIRVCGHGSSTSSRAGGLDVYNLGGRKCLCGLTNFHRRHGLRRQLRLVQKVIIFY